MNAYQVIDNLVLAVYCLSFVYFFLSAVDFIFRKVEEDDYNELGFNEIAQPEPATAPLEAITQELDQLVEQSRQVPILEEPDMSPTILAKLHISKLRKMAGVDATSKLTKKELLAILNV